MKKLRYKRVFLVIGLLLICIIIAFYLFYHRNHYYEYQDDISTYVCTYRENQKIYSFDLKAFQINNEYYVSLNDLYNIIVLLDKDARVYLNESKHMIVYELSHITYYFNYGQDKIVYNNDCINTKDYDTHIYISHKNVYINVFFIEKTIFKNKKRIKFKGVNAIIE